MDWPAWVVYAVIFEIQVDAAGAKENVGVIVGHIVPVTVKLSTLFVPVNAVVALLIEVVVVFTILK